MPCTNSNAAELMTLSAQLQAVGIQLELLSGPLTAGLGGPEQAARCSSAPSCFGSAVTSLTRADGQLFALRLAGYPVRGPRPDGRGGERSRSRMPAGTPRRSACGFPLTWILHAFEGVAACEIAKGPVLQRQWQRSCCTASTPRSMINLRYAALDLDRTRDFVDNPEGSANPPPPSY